MAICCTTLAVNHHVEWGIKPTQSRERVKSTDLGSTTSRRLVAPGYRWAIVAASVLVVIHKCQVRFTVCVLVGRHHRCTSAIHNTCTLFVETGTPRAIARLRQIKPCAPHLMRLAPDQAYETKAYFLDR